MKPGSWSTQKLAAEAAQLEARLTALKLELQKDKARRDAAASAVPAGNETASIWSNGQQGPLRRATAGAQQSGRGGSQKPAAAAAGAAVKRIPGSSNTSTAFNERPGTLRGPGSAKPPAGRVTNAAASFRASPRDDRPATSTSRSSTRPTSCSSATSSTSSLDTKSSDTSTKAAKPQWLQQLKQQQQGSFAAPAQHVKTPGLGSAASAAEREAAAVSTAAAGEWDQQRHSSQAGPAGHTDSPRMSGGSCAGKEACQPDSLLHGRYDEAAAASSFQEALQQWRQAAPDSNSSGQGLSVPTGAAGTAVGTSSGSSRNFPGGTAVAGSRCGTQGDHYSKAAACFNTHGSSSTSSTGSTSAAVSAGHSSRPVSSSVAAFLQKLTTRSSSTGTAAAAPTSGLVCLDSATASVVSPTLPCTLPQPSCSSAGVLDKAAGDDPAPASAHGLIQGRANCLEHLEREEFSQSSLVQPAVVQAAASSAQEALAPSPDDDFAQDDACSSALCFEAFDSWLQAAEQAGAALALHTQPCTGAKTDVNTSLQSSSCSASTRCETAASSSAGEPHAGFQQYHSQLDSMLQAVEQLESQLQERRKPIKAGPAQPA